LAPASNLFKVSIFVFTVSLTAYQFLLCTLTFDKFRAPRARYVIASAESAYSRQAGESPRYHCATASPVSSFVTRRRYTAFHDDIVETIFVVPSLAATRELASSLEICFLILPEYRDDEIDTAD